MRIHNRNVKHRPARRVLNCSDFKRYTGEDGFPSSFCMEMEPADSHEIQWHNIMGGFTHADYWAEVSRKVEVG